MRRKELTLLKGTSILGANNINKENTKKSLNNSLLNNSLNTSSNLQKGTLQQKLENKIKYRPKENNENDRNAHNINLKRKMTIEVDNTKKTLNNSYNLKNNTNMEKDQIKVSVKLQEIPENNKNAEMNIENDDEDMDYNENTLLESYNEEELKNAKKSQRVLTYAR